MKTHDCHAASRTAIPLRDDVKAKLHARCPGAYRTPDGELRRCDCACHGEGGISDEALEATKGLRLNVLEPDAPSAASDPARSKKGRKEASSTPSNKCEHCGAPCRGRFVVGHDAKLKSELTRAARGGDAGAWAELRQRDWARLVNPSSVPTEVRLAGESLSMDPGLTARRNAERAGLRS